MKQELIKIAREVGTSAGVLLPRKLLGATIKITVLEEAPNPLIDSLGILERCNVTDDVLGVYLVGSYSRGDNGLGSDVDVLVITQGTTKIINEGKYNLTLISKEDLEKSLKENFIYYYPMIVEAKTLLNKGLIEDYKKILIEKKDFNSFLTDTQEMIKKIKEMIDSDVRLKNKNTGDSVSYSLVLRLRTLYIFDKLKKGKLWLNKEFMGLINKKIYERYVYVKNGGHVSNKTPIKEATEMLSILEKEVKKWLKEKKD